MILGRAPRRFCHRDGCDEDAVEVQLLSDVRFGLLVQMLLPVCATHRAIGAESFDLSTPSGRVDP